MADISINNIRMLTRTLVQRSLVGQLLGSDMFNSMALSSLLRSPQKSGREITAEALTGLMRSDAGMLRQAAKNVGEGNAIFLQANSAVSSIADALTQMQEIAQSVLNGTATSDATSAYMNLANSINGLVSGTAYNGMFLLDGERWASDERLQPGNGTAAFSIQAGTTPMTLTLRDLSDLKTAFSAEDLDTSISGNVEDTVAKISSLLNTVQTIGNGYAATASGLASQTRSLNRQAEILDTAAARAMPGTGNNPKNILLDLILSERGRIVNTSS
jgi:flagellin-like hook-associated protein FlgL